jgi:hypothetical protein
LQASRTLLSQHLPEGKFTAAWGAEVCVEEGDFLVAPAACDGVGPLESVTEVYRIENANFMQLYDKEVPPTATDMRKFELEGLEREPLSERSVVEHADAEKLPSPKLEDLSPCQPCLSEHGNVEEMRSPEHDVFENADAEDTPSPEHQKLDDRPPHLELAASEHANVDADAEQLPGPEPEVADAEQLPGPELEVAVVDSCQGLSLRLQMQSSCRGPRWRLQMQSNCQGPSLRLQMESSC